MTDEKGSRAGEISRYSFLRVFANDATIDSDELAFMKRLALVDDQVDDKERATLSRIFGRVSRETVGDAVWEEIVAFKERYDIP